MKGLCQEEEKNAVRGGTLYLIATPIGNLWDLSPRALKILGEVDLVAAEDTRNTGKLLSFFSLSRPMISYHEHNKRERGPAIIERLLAGGSCALVSDAGTPAISDPGEDLVALAAAANVPVVSVPGCCAAITALTLSGLPTGHFFFEGFLPVERARRRERLAALSALTDTAIVYEAPHKLRTTLQDLCAALGEERRVALCRELTKRNEEVVRTTLKEAVALYRDAEPRGEYVLVLAGREKPLVAPEVAERNALAPALHVAYYEESGMTHMEAIKAAAKERGIPKSELYRMLEK